MMNIFFLSMCPKDAAKQQCDKHVVKMILETAQMLSTALIILLGNCSDILYKPTHQNHPSNIWARSSKKNFEWLVEHGLELCAEYTRRYKKIHSSQCVIEYIQSMIEKINFEKEDLTTPPMCMPDDCKISNDVVECYKEFYVVHKSKFARWKNSIVPDWYSERILIFSQEQLEFIKTKFNCNISQLQKEAIGSGVPLI